MDERIKVRGICKKCGREELYRSAGGDPMTWCDHCDKQVYNPEKDIAPKTIWTLLWYGFIRR